MASFLQKVKQLFLLTIIFTCIILSIIFIHKNPLHLNIRFLNKLTTIKTESRYPASFVSKLNFHPENVSYCNFNYGLPEKLFFNESDLSFSPEAGKSGKYRVLYDVIRHKHTPEVPEVTYATHITAEFVSYVAEIARVWEGPISVAAFTPQNDLVITLKIINQLCYCLPEMTRVSLQLVFPAENIPAENLFIGKPKNCLVPNSEKLETIRYSNKSIKYPINVCRNVARVSSSSKYVLVSDIQLIPSDFLASKFIYMLENHRKPLNTMSKVVFVLPVFEVESNVEIPKNKTFLLSLLKSERSVYFHRYVCLHCQKFPGIERWLENKNGVEIKPFLTVRREIPYQRWEPIYIGTHSEPLYNENLSWEGLQDKMLQMLEMCLLEYKFIILENAFLVHWPGIKRKKTYEEFWRTDAQAENAFYYKKTLKKFLKKYRNNSKCQLK